MGILGNVLDIPVPPELLKRAAEGVYSLCGKSDQPIGEVGALQQAIAIGRRIALTGKIDGYTQGLISSLVEVTTQARNAANALYEIVDPKAAREAAERAKKLQSDVIVDPTSALSREKALEAVRLIHDHDLDIMRVRKLVALANDMRDKAPEEARTAAVQACVQMRARGLALGPKGSTYSPTEEHEGETLRDAFRPLDERGDPYEEDFDDE